MSGLSGAFRSFLRRPPVEQFFIASLFLVAVAFATSIIPGLGEVGRWASLLSILFFVLGLALSVASRRGYGPPGTKRWRDRDVGHGSSYGAPNQPNLWESVRVWWRRRRFRRL